MRQHEIESRWISLNASHKDLKSTNSRQTPRLQQRSYLVPPRHRREPVQWPPGRSNFLTLRDPLRIFSPHRIPSGLQVNGNGAHLKIRSQFLKL